MKRLLYISFIFLLLTTSCDKFLEQSSQDLIKPLTVAHYEELLKGEAYYKDIYRNGWFVDVMTDNVEALEIAATGSVVNANLEYAKYAYQWAKDLENPEGTFIDKLFQTLYKNILLANVCIESVEDMDGTVQEKQILEGQARFMRAYGYFVLANMYAQAYNESEDSELSVPIITETTPSLKRFNRATKKEVWDLISDDIERALTNLKDDEKIRTVYDINYKAALILASRIYLFKEEYERVIELGNEYLLTNAALRNISNITGSSNSSSASNIGGVKCFLYPQDNAEIAFTFGRISSATAVGGYLFFMRDAISGLQKMATAVSDGQPNSLMSLYTATDRRRNQWFIQPNGAIGGLLTYPYYTPAKFNYYDGARTTQAMRTGEVYLNVAEAYARKTSPENDKAINLLNTLRSNRIGSYTNLQSSSFVNQQAFINFIWEERRRELCFEEFHRWWDLRRIGQPSLTHKWLEEKYVLTENDPAYILNFPKDELEFNPSLIPNNRPERNAQ